jgi:hypothetical protein
MNGYALVKAKYPDLDLPDYVYHVSDEDETGHKRGSKLERVQSMIMDFQYVKWDENHHDTAMAEDRNGSSPDPGSHQEEGCGDEPIEHDEDDADDEEEEEEDGDDDDTVNENSMPEEGSSDVNNDNTTQVVLHQSDDTSHEDNWNEDAAYDHGGEYQSDDVRYKPHPLIQLNQHYEYDPDNVYSMKLPSMLYEPGTIEYIEEIDNLPDPRIYGIDVELLNMFVLIYLANPERPHPFHLYEQYMRHVDPVQKEYQVTVEWAWTVLHTEAEKHKATPCLLSDPNLIIKYLPPFLSTDPHLRSRQIMIVMERYIRQIEPHFHQHLDKAYRDNVEWDYFTKSPTPKASFLRWCRWKCYFVNRYHRYMDRDNRDALSPIDDLPQGPPNWRDVDAPGQKAAKLFIAPPGMPVEIVLVNGEWSRVRDATGDLSWIESRYLIARRSLVVEVPMAAIRATADERAAVIFTAPKGILLELAEPIASGWIKVRHRDGESGFVKASEVWGE